MQELLRASAEILGKGGCGTAYKAVLDDGTVVAVKRLRDATAAAGTSRKEFEQHMDVLGRLRHPNVVPLPPTTTPATRSCWCTRLRVHGQRQPLLAPPRQVLSSVFCCSPSHQLVGLN